MRRGLGLLSMLVVATLAGTGCAGPHTSGAVWAQQDLEQEAALFRVSAQQRAQTAETFELSLADQQLSQERARLAGLLADCPGAGGQPLALSPGDHVRDTIRVQAAGDPGRLAAVAQLALADWRLRRAQQTGEASFCQTAQTALAGDLPAPDPSRAAAWLAPLATATVARDPQHVGVIDAGQPTATALADYALGQVDAVTAAAPLPQYLAAVYGGALVNPPPPAPLPADTRPEQLVDELAPALPEWEPDALYAALAGWPPA